MAEVSGKVEFQGEPLHTGIVVFTPDNSRGTYGPVAMGKIAGDGTFILKTGEEFGAVAGWHRVTVLAVENDPFQKRGENSVPPRNLIPQKYSNPELSGIVQKVESQENNQIDIKLD